MEKIDHTPDPLLAEIEAFIARTGMGPSAFGKYACGNSELVKRLRDGRDVTRGTATKVQQYMAEYSLRQPA